MEVIKIVTGTLEENCYLLKKGNHCLLIDPGANSNIIKQHLGDTKILAILITHMHFDHVGALRDFLADQKKLKVYKNSNLEKEQPMTIGDFTFTPLKTPGHTSDSLSFYFAQENCLFTGDFLFKDTVGRVDLPTGDEQEMELSLRKISTYPDTLIVYPGHGETTTLGREKQFNWYLTKDNLSSEKEIWYDSKEE